MDTLVKCLPKPADYASVAQAMQEFTSQRSAATADELWLVEHSPVYTLGQAGLAEHILNPHGIPVIRCNRGGQVTYHGPGQIVLYTLMDLRRKNMFVRPFVSLLEQAVLDTLSSFGINSACRKPGAPGIYVPPKALSQPASDDLAKIAALGVKVSKGCTYHGLALNVAMDLSPFLGINPCGFAGLQTVDMQACGVRAQVDEVGAALALNFQRLWAQA